MRNAILLLSMTALLAACGGEPAKTAGDATTATAAPAAKPKTPPPTVAEAHDLIAAAPEFGDYQFTNAAFSLPLKTSMMNDETKATAKQLQAGGWIRMHGDAVELTSKASSDKRFLVRPNGFVDIVPLAKKEMGEVHSVTPAPDGDAHVDFSWTWIPNDVAASVTSGPLHDRFAGEQRADATLIHTRDGWEILRIEPFRAPAP